MGPKRSTLAALATMLAAGLGLLTAGSASGAVRTAANDYGKAERAKTLPISKRAWQEPRSVMSLGPERVGELLAGDRIEAAGDFEVTVCLKPNPRHPGDGQPCVGDIYAYNPTIRAKLVLAPSEGATAPGQTKPISKTYSLTCHQNHPVRNHHCVISIPWSGIRVGEPSTLPCDQGSCHINVVATASHPSAGSGEKVVIGSSDDRKRIHQGLAQLSSVRHRPGESRPSKTWRGGRASKRLPVVSKGQKIKRKVIYSAKVSRLKAGDQLVVDARARTAIGHLPYNAFQRTEVVFAKTKNSTTAFGKPLDTTARVTSSSGFNCTRKRSGHSNVCEIRKGGVLSVKKNVKGPLYVNIVAGQHAIGTTPQTDRWRQGHTAKVPRSGGYVRVERYRGSSACKTCATGWTRFSAQDRPQRGKPAKLVEQLAPFGIRDGDYNCAGRNGGGYVCKWRAEGRFGASPRYRCETRAKWSKKRKRFRLKVCKDALASQLWHELLTREDPVEPNFTGACKERSGGSFRCKWYGEGIRGAIAGRYCKGFGVYDRSHHRWKIDACRP